MNNKNFTLIVMFFLIGLSLFVFTLFSYKTKIQASKVQTAVNNSSIVNKNEISYESDYLVEENKVESILSSSSSSSTQSIIPDLSIKYKVSSIMYHHINPITVNDKKDKLLAGLSVSPDKFENDLKDIQKKGYETIYPYEVEEMLKNNVKQDKKYVMITIDDGYEDVYKYAMPILKKYNMKASYYVVPNLMERKDSNRTDMGGDYVTWEELIDMKNSGYINIGSHTMDHYELTNKKYNEVELKYQIFESKKILEERLGITIKDFSYPYGKYNEQIIKLVKEAGYLTSTITKGGNDVSLNNIFEIPRFHSSNTNPFRNLIK